MRWPLTAAANCAAFVAFSDVFSISGDGLKEIACWDLDVDSRSCQIFASQNARVFAYRNKTARAYALAVFVILIVLFAR